MITISEQHYNQLIQLIRMQNKNIQLIYPCSSELANLYSSWKQINQSLHKLYKQLQIDLQEILTNNNQLRNENVQLNNKLQNQKIQNNNLIQSITMQRAELAKNQAEVNRYKDGVKKLKQSFKQKQNIKDQLIIQLQRKVKKYKKSSEEYQRKFEKLDKKITQLTQIQIAQRSSAKEKQLDQQLLQLQNLCEGLDQNEKFMNQFDEEVNDE